MAAATWTRAPVTTAAWAPVSRRRVAWAVGPLVNCRARFPEGTGIKLQKGTDVVMQIHYHRNGKLEKDKTAIGIYFSKKKVERPFQGGVMAGLFLAIPANNEHFVVKGTSYVTQDMTLYDVMPHMHMLGQQIKVTMTPPDGKPELLFNVKQWDYNWQETYNLKEPLKVKNGSRLEVEAVYDNSAKNPNNPFSPPRMVTLGEQTFNEMCFVFLGGTSDKNGTALPMAQTPQRNSNHHTNPKRERGHLFLLAYASG